MINIRTLGVEELEKLKGTPLETMASLEQASVLVAETPEGEVVGAWPLMLAWHADGAWVHEEHRKRGVVAGRLLEGMRALMDAHRVPGAFCLAETEESATALRKLGARPVKGELYVWYVRE